MGGSEQQFVNQVFESNWIAPLGPMVDGFEYDLAKYVGMKHAAALSSGTAAIHLALIILGIEQDDEVICQSMTFSGTVNPIAYQKATPVFIDSEPDGWNMDPEFLELAIKDRMKKGKKPKAIIPVHLYGLPARMYEIHQIAGKYEIPIIEDAAEALGSTINGKKCGSFGLMNILSFNGNKIITTSGGGALLSDNASFVSQARFLSTQAREKATHYQHNQIGYNYRLSNVLAAIGRGQMQVLDERVAAHRANYDRYFNYFNSLNNKGFLINFQKESEGLFSNRWLTSVIIDPKRNKNINREKLRLALDSNNIESRPLWKPMHLQPVFKNNPFYGNGTSERLFENGLCLPSGSNLNNNDFERIFRILDSVFI